MTEDTQSGSSGEGSWPSSPPDAGPNYVPPSSDRFVPSWTEAPDTLAPSPSVLPMSEVLQPATAGPSTPPIPPEKSRRLPWMLALIGTVVLLGGGTFFALNAFGASGGGETPDEAVELMLAAINSEDVVTIGELLEPGERRTIAKPMLTDILPELQRLGVFTENLDANDVSGVDFEFTDVTWRLEEVPGAPELRHVYFNGGTGAYQITGEELPFGDVLSDWLGEPEDQGDSDEIGPAEEPVVLVERDGRWYFSAWYLLAETARLQTNSAMPDASEVPPAIGSSEPAEAVEGMIEAVLSGEIRGIIGRMDPEEAAALYRYSPLFLDELDELRDQFAELGSEVSVDVTDLAFDTTTDGDDASVRILAATVSISTPEGGGALTFGSGRLAFAGEGVFDGEAVNGEVEVTDRALRLNAVAGDETYDVTANVADGAESITVSGTVAGEALVGSVELSSPCGEFEFELGSEVTSGCLSDELGGQADSPADIALQLDQFFDLLGEDGLASAVATRRTNGEWFVSPTMTMMNSITAQLEDVSKEDFDAQVAQAEAAFGGYDAILDAAGSLGGSDDMSFSLAEPLDAELGEYGSDEFEFDEYVEWAEVYRGTVDLTATNDFGVAMSMEPQSYDTWDVLIGEPSALVTITVRGSDLGLVDPSVTLWSIDDLGNFTEVGYNDDAFGDDPSGQSLRLLDSQLTEELAGGGYVLSVDSVDGTFGDYILEVQVE